MALQLVPTPDASAAPTPPTQVPTWDESTPVGEVAPTAPTPNPPAAPTTTPPIPSWGDSTPVTPVPAPSQTPSGTPTWDDSTPVGEASPAYTPDASQAGGLVSRGGSALLSADDVTRMATASGADESYIRSAAPWLGLAASRPAGSAPSASDDFKQLVGATAGGYVPDFGVDLYKKLAESDPAKRRALDALQEEAHSRRSYASSIGAQVAPALATEGLSSAVGAGVAGAAGLAGATGALETSSALGVAVAASQRAVQTVTMIGAGVGQGAVEAPEGHEMMGAMVGGFAAVGLPLALKGIGAAGGAAVSAVREGATSALSEFLLPTGAVDAAKEAFESNGEAEAVLSKVVQEFNPNTKPQLQYFMANTSPEERASMATLARDFDADAPPAPVDAISREVHEDFEADFSEGEGGGPPKPPPTEDDRLAYNAYLETRDGLGRILGVQGDADWQGAFERGGDEYVANRIAAYRMGTHLRDAIGNSPDVRSLGDVNWVRRAYMYLADSRYVYDSFDQRFATEFGPLLSKGSQAYGRFTQSAAPSSVAQRDVARLLAGAESRTRSGAPFMDVAADAGRAGEFPETEFTDKQIAALRAQRDYYTWDRARAVADSNSGDPGVTPIDIPSQTAGSENSYVPNYAVENAAGLGLTRARLEAATGTTEVGAWRDEAGRLFAAVADGSASPAEAETAAGLGYHYGAPLSSVEDARAAADVVAGLVPRTGAGTRSSAASLFQREGEIPNYLLERDPLRLMNGWSTSIYRHIHLREFISNLSLASEALSDVSPVSAQYVRNHVADLLGSNRASTLAGTASKLMDKMRISAARAAANTDNPVAKAGFQLAANADDVLRAATANMYSFYLGLNPASAGRYAAQTITSALPQMSPEFAADASARVAKAYIRTAADLFARDGTNAFSELADAGYLPAARYFEAQAQARAAMSSTLIGRWNESSRAAAHALSMKMIQSADVVGRYSCLQLARGVAEDAAAGDPAALAHIARVPTGFAMEIRRALRAGDVESAADSYARYMIGTTQGNYDRVAMSEYGRSMGYVFSMFTKWPTMALGELGGIVDARSIGKPLNGDVGRVLWKYIAPMIATNYAQSIWGEQFADAPAPVRAVVGRDVRKWFPSESLTTGVSLPIPVEAAKAAWQSATAGNWSGLLGGVLGQAAAMSPFGVGVHFMTNTLPGWMGEEPLIPLTPREISAAVRGD